MSMADDFALMIERFCNRDGVEEVPRSAENPHGLVDHGMRLDYDMFMALTPSCSLVAREQVHAALSPWAQREIQRSVDEANAVTARITEAGRRGGRRAA